MVTLGVDLASKPAPRSQSSTVRAASLTRPIVRVPARIQSWTVPALK